MNTTRNSNFRNSISNIVFSFIIILIISLFSINSYSTTISTISSGSWTTKTIWNLGRVPVSTDDVIINNTVNVNTNGVVIASLMINSGNSFSLNAGTDLTVNGNAMINGNMTLNNSSSVTAFTVKGNFTINSGAVFSETGNNDRFYFSGTSQQTFINNGTISSYMYDLTVNNPAGLTFQNSITVGGTLNMLAGNIDLSFGSGFTLTLGTSTSNPGTLNYTSGKIITSGNGGFIRWFTNATVSNVIFPVGTANNLNQIKLSFTVAPTTGGTLTGRFISTTPGTTSATSITDVSYTVNTYSPTGYWQIDNSGITNGTYNIGLEGQGFNVGGTSILNYAKLRVIKRTNSSSSWSTPGTHQDGTGSNNDATAWRYGITGFGQFDFGGNSVDNPFAGPLPVELSSFTSAVKGRNVNLNWSTASEQNNAGFQIERTNLNSKDQTWTVLGFVTGKNNSSSLNNYSYTDEKLQAGKYQYRMKQVDFNGNYKYYDLNNVITIGEPTNISLSQNYPNPFNPVTKVDYSLPSESNVSLVIYDMLGRKVQNIVSEHQQAGFYSIQINANNLSSGVYFYRLLAETNGQSFVMTKKMNVIK